MRVFITGIDGMLGSAIAKLHLKRGDEVTGCDIWDFTTPERLCDIRNAARLEALIKHDQPHRIYHCAAMLGVQNTEEHPAMCKQVNEEGTAIVADLARQVKAELVFLSSSEVYGNQIGRLSEKSPLLGNNVYALSKVVGEAHVKGVSGKVKTTVCRMFNCFGPLQVRQFFIPKVIDRALSGAKIPIYGDPSNMRSYLLSADAAKFIIDAADRPDDGHLTVNVAHPQLITLDFVVDRVMHLTGSKSTIEYQRGEVYEDRARARDVPNRIADTTLLSSLTQHRPSIFVDALRFAVQTFSTTRPDWTYKRGVL